MIFLKSRKPADFLAFPEIQISREKMTSRVAAAGRMTGNPRGSGLSSDVQASRIVQVKFPPFIKRFWCGGLLCAFVRKCAKVLTGYANRMDTSHDFGSDDMRVEHPIRQPFWM